MSKSRTENPASQQVRQLAQSIRAPLEQTVSRFDELLSSFDPRTATPAQKLELAQKMGQLSAPNSASVDLEKVSSFEQAAQEAIGLASLAATELDQALTNLGASPQQKDQIMSSVARFFAPLSAPSSEPSAPPAASPRRMGLSEVVGPSTRDIVQGSDNLNQLLKAGLLTDQDIDRPAHPGRGPKVLISPYAAALLKKTLEIKSEIYSRGTRQVSVSEIKTEILTRTPSRELVELVGSLDTNCDELQVLELVYRHLNGSPEVDHRRQQLSAQIERDNEKAIKPVDDSRRLIRTLAQHLSTSSAGVGDLLSRRPGWDYLARSLQSLPSPNRTERLNDFFTHIEGKSTVQATGIDPDSNTLEVRRKKS